MLTLTETDCPVIKILGASPLPLPLVAAEVANLRQERGRRVCTQTRLSRDRRSALAPSRLTVGFLAPPSLLGMCATRPAVPSSFSNSNMPLAARQPPKATFCLRVSGGRGPTLGCISESLGSLNADPVVPRLPRPAPDSCDGGWGPGIFFDHDAACCNRCGVFRRVCTAVL